MPRSFPVPAPPYAEGAGLPWDVTVEDAVAAIADARARYGDTFVVESGGDHYLFVFSAVGVESFYALPEEKASKAVADYMMLRRKLPDEIFDGRRVLPNALFRRDDVASYLVNLDRALEHTDSELGREGAVAASDKRAEKAALDDVAEVIESAVRRMNSGATGEDLFGRILDAWESEPPKTRMRGIALDVALIHIASMSNLMAALGWALVDLLEHPAELRRVAMGDIDLAQRCALESTRMAQRSIMSRVVLFPVELDAGAATYRIPSGWTIATLLPLLNMSAAPGLQRWEPQRWHRHRLADTSTIASPMLVTAFGHGKHSCPAQPFSLAAMTAAMTHLCSRYDLTPGWRSHPRPVPAQIGGVARASERCPIRYIAR